MALKTVLLRGKKIRFLIVLLASGWCFFKKRKVCFDEDYTEQWLWKVQELFSSDVCLLDWLSWTAWCGWLCRAAAVTSRSSSVLVQHGLVALMCQHLFTAAEAARPCCIIIHFPKTNQPELVLLETIWRTSAYSQTCLVSDTDGGVVAFVIKAHQDHRSPGLPRGWGQLIPPGDIPGEGGMGTQSWEQPGCFTGCVLVRVPASTAKGLCLHCRCRSGGGGTWAPGRWEFVFVPQPLAAGDSRAVPVTPAPAAHFVLFPLQPPEPAQLQTALELGVSVETAAPRGTLVQRGFIWGGISAQSRWGLRGHCCPWMVALGVAVGTEAPRATTLASVCQLLQELLLTQCGTLSCPNYGGRKNPLCI